MTWITNLTLEPSKQIADKQSITSRSAQPLGQIKQSLDLHLIENSQLDSFHGSNSIKHAPEPYENSILRLLKKYTELLAQLHRHDQV